jgi:1,4-dihydroxy-2-naphthoate polyprenyltransferase
MKLAGTMRPPFLILAPACVLPGIATAHAAGVSLPWWEVVFVLLGAICAHIGVNVFNEYQDWKSKLDSTTNRTPFSGGSGTLQRHPELAKAALILGICVTAAAAGFGLYFVLSGKLLLLAIGGIGVLSVALYTPWIARSPIACLLAPGLGFGTCMVLGAHVAFGAPITWMAFTASFVPFFLVSNLLLLNQFPDIEQDRAVGRKNIIIAYGNKTGVAVYGLFLLLCYLAIGAGVATSTLPVWSLLGLITLPAAVAAFSSAAKYAVPHAGSGDVNVEKLIPGLGMNVMINILTPALVAVGIFIG